MKKVKIGFFVFVLAVVALAIYQNRGFLMSENYVSGNSVSERNITKDDVSENRLKIDLSPLIKKEITQTAAHPLAVYLVASFLLGFLISYFSSLGARFRAKKAMRTQAEELKGVKSMLEELKSRAQAGYPRPQGPPGE